MAGIVVPDRARTCIYHSTHEVSTALDKDILFLTEKKKIREKIRHVEVGTEQQTSIIKIQSSSLFFMTFIMFTAGCSPIELINLAIIQKKKRGP